MAWKILKLTTKQELTYERARVALAETLATGISDVRVLEQFLKERLEAFVPLDGAFNRAYEDMSLPIGYRQTISQPYVVAKMTEVLIKECIGKKTIRRNLRNRNRLWLSSSSHF